MSVLAWHFLPENGCFQYPPHTKVEAGVTYRHDREVILCKSGLHASVRALDALQYAPGAIVCRVECGGIVVRGDNKLACSSRKVLWMADATNTLHEFACQLAEECLRSARVTDAKCWEAIEVKRRWVRGEATAKDLYAARDAACSAARAAAMDAAWSAARAARAAAMDAAWSAAWSAAMDAAWSAARAARAAAMDAACSATRDAARAAAWDAQNERLETMLWVLKKEKCA